MKKSDPTNQFIISGPPGSGKTSLINALRQRGLSCVDEPARRVIAEQRQTGGRGTSDQDPSLFVELMLEQTIADYDAHPDDTSDTPRPVFFDRGLPDLIAYAEDLNVDAATAQSVRRAGEARRYNSTVFFAPPWRAIFTNDAERTLSFEATEAFSVSLEQAFEMLEYTLVVLPMAWVERRADLVLSHPSVAGENTRI